MAKHREYEDLDDVDLSAEDAARFEDALAQADSERPPASGSLHAERAACGPSTATCRCECAWDPPPDTDPDWRPRCDHVWDGEWVEFRDISPRTGKEYVSGGSASCSRCGMLSIDHSLWVGP